MKIAILDFLQHEMKNTSVQISNIVSVFPPAKADWNTLYAEFDSIATAQTVYRFSKYLRNDQHKINMYIPNMFYDQFNHLSHLAYKYRIAVEPHKTRIRFGNNNMYLQVLAPGERRWKLVSVPDLPAVREKPQYPDEQLSPSLAKGRSKQQSKRLASASPEQQTHPKVPRPAVIHQNNTNLDESHASANTEVASVADQSRDFL